MNNIVSTLIYLFVGYLVGAWLAPDVFSMTVSATDWASLWVYGYMLFWPFILMWKAIIWMFFIGVIIFVAIKIYEKATGVEVF